ncbi:unnamed protein product [Pylaiella littoralis]
MAQFLIKIVNHFASEVITKRLANSRAFQQFAMKTHLKVEETKKVVENPEEAAKLLRGAEQKVKAEAESVVSSFERFKAALKEEVSQGGASSSSSSGSSGSSGRPTANNFAAKSGAPTSTSKGGGGVSSDIAARVRRRRR